MMPPKSRASAAPARESFGQAWFLPNPGGGELLFLQDPALSQLKKKHILQLLEKYVVGTGIWVSK